MEEQESSHSTIFQVKIDATSIKAFSAALHLLQKIGKDMIMEVEEVGLTIRALNETKSAFIAVEFNAGFFDAYDLLNNSPFSCRLAVKPICSILRNLKSLKNLIIAAKRYGIEHRLVINFNLVNGITRSYQFCYSDCEVLNAVFNDEDCSYIKVRPKVMAQLLEYIHKSPEIVAIAAPNVFSVKSFHQPETVLKDYKSILSTGLTVNIQEFDAYDYRSDFSSEELVFCLREVASFVGFCEAIELPSFDFFFSSGGRAIKFSGSQQYFSTSLILATVEHASDGRERITTAKESHLLPPDEEQEQGDDEEEEREVEDEGEEESSALRAKAHKSRDKVHSPTVVGISSLRGMTGVNKRRAAERAEDNDRLSAAGSSEDTTVIQKARSIAPEHSTITPITRRRRILPDSDED